MQPRLSLPARPPRSPPTPAPWPPTRPAPRPNAPSRAPDEVPGAMPAAAEYPDDLRNLVEEYLAGLRYSDRAETIGIEEAMQYSLLAGGKRVRPVLCLATARSLGIDPATVLPT